MKTETHFKLAIKLCEQGFLLATASQKAAFINGNIMPDINLFSYLRGFKTRPFFGHDWQNAKGFILSSAEKLTAGQLGFFGLGVFLHYLCDAFTHTHNIGFCGSLQEHTIYEKRLHTCVLEGDNRFEAERLNCPLSDFIINLHRLYERATASLTTDVEFILSAVGQVMAVFKSSQKLPLADDTFNELRCVERYISRP